MRNVLVAATLPFSLLFALFAPGVMAGVDGWDYVGNGGAPGTASLNGTVRALHVSGADLYVGGDFTDAGGVASADYIAKWNGTAWSGFAPLNGGVYAIAFAGGRLFAGGAFTNAGGNPNADFLAAWTGSAWEAFCNNTFGPAFNGNVLALRVIGNTLYIGGSFQNGDGLASADYLLACDLTTGFSFSTVMDDGDMAGPVYALTADNSGTLYVGGAASNIDGNPAIDYIGAFDGAWHAMGSGPGPGGSSMNGFVRALASDGTNVYAGTDSTAIAGIAGANHVARWDGTATWHAMGSNYFTTTTTINALAVNGSVVVAGGSFQNANGDPLSDMIVYWDGFAWHPLGSDGAGNGPLQPGATAVAAFATQATRLFAGGSFTSAEGDALARFLAQTPQPPPRLTLFADGFEQ